jgi:hypothetical protein
LIPVPPMSMPKALPVRWMTTLLFSLH